MSARAEVQVLERGMVAPRGVRFAETALVFDDPSEATFIETGAWLQRIEGCRAWWWGDYISAYCAWRVTQDVAAKKLIDDAESKERAQVEYAARYAEAAGVSTDTLHDWKSVAEFYPPGCRQPTLSYAHHWEAKVGAVAAGGLPTALQWLSKSHAQGWSKTELRGNVRASRIAETTTHEPRPTERLHELYVFKIWARGQLACVAAMHPDDARAMRTEMEPAAKLLAALDAKLSGVK